MSNQLEELKARLDACREEQKPLSEGLRKLQVEEASLKRRAAEMEFGIQVGDIVLHRGVKHRVVNVRPAWGKPWLKGNPIKKDGTFGTAERQLFDSWEPVKETA